MQDLVGIILTESELLEALKRLDELSERAANVGVEGHRQFNPGWHLALDLQAMLSVARCTTLAALERKESRGGHTRADFPDPDPSYFATLNMVARLHDGAVTIVPEALPKMPEELMALFTEAH
jgi:succinate dehydrogenase / fumarate reductase flavoprotein subunit